MTSLSFPKCIPALPAPLFTSILFAFCLLLTHQQAQAQNVTVSGAHASSNGSYATLKAAFDAINAQSQTGNAIVVTVSASTTETAAAVLNAGTWTTLTVKPAAATTPTVSGNISSAIIKLDGADNVTIDGSNSGGTDRSLTISNTNTADLSTVIWISSLGTGAGATGNTIKNCNVAAGSNITLTFGIVASGSGNPFANGADNDNLTIQNNAVTKAGFGIFVMGDAPGVNDNLVITQNSIGSNSAASYVRFYGIYLGNATGSTVSQNTIFNIISTEFNPVGMLIDVGFVNSTISRNEIRSVHYVGSDGSGGKGIFVATGSASSNLTIANNLISDIKGDGASSLEISRIVGIFIEGSSGGVTLQYNSVNLGSGSFAGNATGTISAALFVGSTSTSITLQNNILSTNLVNTNAAGAKTYAIYSAAPASAFSNIDYNDYYVSGSQGVLGFLTSDRTTLADWKTATSQDDHSLDVNPPFTSPTNLHLHPGIPTQLESGGTTVSVTNDFDGDTRNNPPDIGGDECACFGSMNYSSSTVTQTETASVNHNTTNNQVIGIEILTVNAFNPINATSFTVNTTGTTSTADIANAKLWYTFTSSTFFPGLQFGSTVASPSGSFNITGTQALAPGTNYFWLTYDVVAGANNGNVIDAQCTSLTVGGNTHPPTVTAPAGSRTIAGPLSGTYTVGTGGAFSTLKAAADHANANGLKGNVTLSILASGTTETGTASFDQWTEYGGSNFTLTIKPAASTTPTISGNIPDAVIKLNGADRVTIDGSNAGGTDRSLTISNTSTEFNSSAIWIASLGTGAGATNNTIKNCNIAAGSNAVQTFGIVATSTSLFMIGQDNDNLTIQNNAITKAYYGIAAVADDAAMNDNLMIVQNSIGSNTAANSISYAGLYISGTSGATISQNTIFNITADDAILYSPNGMILSLGPNSVVSRNEIRGVHAVGALDRGGVGMTIYANEPNTNLLVTNNMISDITGNASSEFYTTILGIYVSGIGGVTLQYNSVNLGSGSFAGYASATRSAALFVENGTSALTLQNNVFATNLFNTNHAGAKTYAVYCLSPATAFTVLDYNDYYVSGAQGVLGYLDGDRPTLNDWKAATGKDIYSLNANPPFTSATDLHLNTGTATPLESGGTAVAITTDFDGNTRNNPPDIGADECACTPAASMTYSSCTVAQNNAFIVTQNTTHNDVIDIQIVTTNSGAALSATSFTVNTTGTTSTADIANAKLWFTGTSGTFATNIQFGGTQASPAGTFTFTGSVVLAEGTNHFWLTYDVTTGAVEGNVIDAQCTAFVVGGNTHVPTVTAPAGNRLILGPMSGTYTVGTGGTYPKLKSAADEMNVRGLKGNVNLSILAGGTTETAEASFNQWAEFLGSGYTLTIKPAAGTTPTISGNISTAVIKLNGADRVTIDGSNSGGTDRSLSIINTDTSTRTAVIWIASLGTGTGATNNTVKNCNISAGSNTNTTYGIIAAGTSINSTPFGEDNDNLTIQNNAVTKARIGIFARGTTAGLNDNLTIVQNAIGSNTPANYVTLTGLDVARATGASISQNTIFNIISSNGGPNGINVFNGFVNSTISRNEIRGIHYVGTQDIGATGMAILPFVNASNLTIVNNVVSDIRGNGNSSVHNSITGIRISGVGTGGITLEYNSVNLGSGSYAGSANGFFSVALAVGITNVASSLTIRNNIFANNLVNANQPAAKSYAIHSLAPASIFAEINYNDYFASGTQGVLGYLGGDQTTLSDWKTATGKDASSVTGDPGFTAPDNLFIDNANPNCWNVNGKGKQTSVTEDFGSASANRSTAVANGAPDIGADEFSVNASLVPPTLICFTPVVGANDVVIGQRTIATLTFGAGGALPSQICASYFTDVTPPDPSNGGQSGIGSANFIKAYLQLDATGGSGYTYDLAFNYDEALLGSVGEMDAQFDLAQKQTLLDGTWNDLGAAANTATNQLTVTGLTTISLFSITNADLNLNQNNWTGAVNTDWFNAGNWSAGVPTASSAAVIPNVANDPVVGAAGAVARSIFLGSGAILNISVSGTLAVDGAGSQGFWNLGTVLNGGSVNIGVASGVGNYGIINEGTFSNNVGGQLTINRAGNAGIRLNTGTFLNSGTVTIGSLVPVTNLMTSNTGTFFNNTGGVINGSGNVPAANFFNNGGTLSPGYSAGTMTFNDAEDFNASTLKMEISETGGVVSKDLVSVSGNAGLTGGVLNILAGGTVPGGTHQLLSFTGNSGSTQFTTVNFPALCGACSLVYSPTGVSLSNTMACFPNLTLNNMTLATGTYRSQGILISGMSTVANGSTVEFKSDTGIELQAGFTADLGGVFEAVITTCQ